MAVNLQPTLFKVKDKRKILIICMIFVVSAASGQDKLLQTNANKAFSYSLPNVSYNKILINLPALCIPSNFYSYNLGFFCRQEIKFATVTKIPLKLRIGSVQYCDWMEGKKAAGVLKPGN